jgi:DNA-binding MarR family transcriptional regulator
MMHRSQQPLAAALLTLLSVLNDPRQDWRMMAEAGLDLDPVFLPLLVGLGGVRQAGVVELAERLGRDHSTISRQLAKLEVAGLVARSASQADARVRTASLTPTGEAAVATLADARDRLLKRALAGWTVEDRDAFTELFGRFAGALSDMVKDRR